MQYYTHNILLDKLNIRLNTHYIITGYDLTSISYDINWLYDTFHNTIFAVAALLMSVLLLIVPSLYHLLDIHVHSV